MSTRGRRWDNVRSKIKIFPYRGGRLSPVTKLYGISHVDRLRSQPNVGKLDSIIIDNNGLLLHGTSPTRGLYSRKAVAWEVHTEESGEYAAALIQRGFMAEQCWRQPLVLHSDHGAPMKSSILLAKLYDNDNPYSESLFRTLKYCPQWPESGFADLDTARIWVRDFIAWYNHEHRHRRIRFVTPAQRHRGEDHALLTKRHVLYEAGKARNPARWSGGTRHWTPVGAVDLNPQRQDKKAT